MIIRKKIFLAVITFYLFAYSFNHLLANSNTGATFLKIGIGARPVGLGSAFTAISNDVTAIHWNPAGLAQLTKREISAMHTQWLVDTKLDFIGFALPLNLKSYTLYPAVIAGSIIYLSQSELEKRDEAGKKTGTFNAADLAATLSYSKRLEISNKHSVLAGVNIKFIQQQIESEEALGIAFDLGSLYRFTALPLTAGLSIQNLGPQMKFISTPYNLPLSLSAGLAYNISMITIALDLKHWIHEGKTTISLGTEYYPVNSLTLRAGYLFPIIGKTTVSTDDKLSGLNNLTGLSAGIGIRLFGLQTDYSFVPYGILGDAHRISFIARF